jgi:hypothetical protein
VDRGLRVTYILQVLKAVARLDARSVHDEGGFSPFLSAPIQHPFYCMNKGKSPEPVRLVCHGLTEDFA